MKFCKILKFFIAVKIWHSKLTFLNTRRHAKDEIWQNQKFSVAVKIWLKIETF